MLKITVLFKFENTLYLILIYIMKPIRENKKRIGRHTDERKENIRRTYTRL